MPRRVQQQQQGKPYLSAAGAAAALAVVKIPKSFAFFCVRFFGLGHVGTQRLGCDRISPADVYVECACFCFSISLLCVQ